MRDREDAGVLATAFAARAHLLVTDNLADFEGKAVAKLLTSLTRQSNGALRQLYRLIHRGNDGHRLVVAHSFDVLAQARRGGLAAWIAQ